MADTAFRDAVIPGGAQDASGSEARTTKATDPAIPLGDAPEAGVLDAGDANISGSGELIEPGRTLALADFAPPSLGAGERLLRLAYRVGIPASMLTLPLGKAAKPRIIAAVANPLPGQAAAGTALRAGHFLVHGVKAPIAQIDFGGAARLTPPFERVVHSFSWLADLEACGAREHMAPVAARIMTAWLDANPKTLARPGKRPAWILANAGTRVLNWLVHAPLIFASDDKALRKRVLAALADTARWLDRNVGSGDDRLAELAGWCGIVAAGLLMVDGKPRRLFGEAGLVRALGELVGDDGGVMSRSPLGQMEAIELLVRLRSCYDAAKREPPAALETMLSLLVPPLLALTHGDGSLGAWQGGWAVDAETLAKLVAASGVRTRPLRDVRQWGYQRVAAQKGILQFDAAPPPLPRHARNGCASTLAFEFSHAGERIIVNCGGAACAGGLVPVRLEQGLRASAAHSTLVLDDANSTAVLINGRIGSGVSEVDVDRRTLDTDKSVNRSGGGATRIEASHDGYGARYGLIHRRILILRDDGGELRGEDMLVPNGRKGKRGKVAYAIRFHLGPGIEARLSSDGQGAGLALNDGSYWQFRVADGELAIEDSIWVDGQARLMPVQQLVIQGLASRGGGNFSWLLKKMG
jgi:uncharacterized heparinase superfamily protein